MLRGLPRFKQLIPAELEATPKVFWLGTQLPVNTGLMVKGPKSEGKLNQKMMVTEKKKKRKKRIVFVPKIPI